MNDGSRDGTLIELNRRDNYKPVLKIIRSILAENFPEVEDEIMLSVWDPRESPDYWGFPTVAWTACDEESAIWIKLKFGACDNFSLACINLIRQHEREKLYCIDDID